LPGHDDTEPVYPHFNHVVALYADLFGCGDSEAEDQLRDPDGLRGAIVRPQMHAHYAAADIAQQAAVLAHGIAEGQYFVEGNKRIALVAMGQFLQANGYELLATQPERAEWIIALSAGLGVEWLAEKVRAALDPEP
jgi:death-on-curing protein